MDINIIAGKSSEQNNQHIFSLLKSRDRSKKHIIIAPDRNLFSIEQRLFEETGEACFFDIAVTSISKLSKGILNKINNKKILTKQSGVALVKKLLIDNKDKLNVFKKSSAYMGFASTLFETICLYKSCNISCDDVYVDDSINHSNLKQKDIKLIYSEYERFLHNDYTDSFNQLILFANNIDSDFCKDTIFYFIEFEDFTSIMYSIILKLAKFSEKIYLTATYGKDNNNKNIYSNKIYYDLISLFKSEGLNYKVNKLTDEKNSLDALLLNNLLSYHPQSSNIDNNKIKINCFDNILDEIKFTIAEIYSKVLKDNTLTFSDFAIVLPNIHDYISIIKRELGNYGITYFIDKNEILIDHIIVRVLIDICRVIIGDFAISDFMNILKSSILNFDQSVINDYDNYLHKCGTKGYEAIQKFNFDNEDIKQFIDLIINLKKQIKECTNWCEYFENIVFKIYNYIIARSQDYVTKLTPLDVRIYNQVLDKFESINNDFLSVFRDNQSSFKEFFETYISYFETTNLSLPPITSNTLFIADFNSSYLSTYAHVYILGCNEGVMPKLKLDNGLVTDEEIARLPNASKINPTIAVLNTRKIFKLFELVFKAKKSLTLSYMTSNNKGTMYPNNIILSLIKILDIKVNNGSIVLDQIANSFYKLNPSNIIYNNLTPKVSINNILSFVKQNQTYKNNSNYSLLLSTLMNVNNSDYLNNLIQNFESTTFYKNLGNVNLFKNNTTSVSQIECYYNCPYMHFVRYGLKLNKKQEYKFEANDIGTIIHQVLKDIMPELISIKDSIKAIVRAKEILSEILNSDEYSQMSNNPINAYVIKALYNEIERVCIAIINEINSSEFKPNIKYLEYNFNPNNLVFNGIKVRGCIDRVDMLGNDFVIIDYKTGNNQFSNYNDVYSGKKLQLLVYAKAFGIESNLNLKGAYYFPLSNGFAKDESTYAYRLNGVTYKSKENILAMDKSLNECSYKSKILNLTTTKDGEFYKNNYYNYLCLEKNDFDYLVDFTIKQVDVAIRDILSGNINPHPIRSGQNKACKYCEYRGLCNYLDNNDNIEQNISSIEELKKKEQNNGTISK